MNKKAMSTMGFIGAAIIMILILLLSSSQILKAVGKGNDAINGCESPNVLVDGRCPIDLSFKKPMSTTDKGLNCCIPFKDKEKALKEFAADVNHNIDDTIFTYGDTNIQHKPVVFQIGTNNLDYKGIRDITRNEKFVLVGQKLFEEGKHCSMSIVKAKKTGGVLTYSKESNGVVISPIINDDCKLETTLKITGEAGLPGNHDFGEFDNNYYAVLFNVSDFEKPHKGESYVYWAFLRVVDPPKTKSTA